MKLRSLTSSQWAAIGSTVAAFVVTLSENLPQVQAVVPVPHGVAQAIQFGAVVVNLFSRSVVPSKSGVAPLGLETDGSDRAGAPS
jgi:ABC-type uncharacterized transport system permease subunit